MGSWVERTWARQWLEDLGGKGSGWRTGRSHICVHINWEEQLGSETDHATQGSSGGNKASKPLTVKTCGGCGAGRNYQPHKGVHWRDPQ